MKSYFLIIITVFAVIIYPLSIWTDRTLEFWLTYFKGQEVVVPQWISFVATLVLNGVVVGINILSEILRLVVG